MKVGKLMKSFHDEASFGVVVDRITVNAKPQFVDNYILPATNSEVSFFNESLNLIKHCGGLSRMFRDG